MSDLLINDYQIDQHIGRGGMGSVYKVSQVSPFEGQVLRVSGLKLMQAPANEPDALNYVVRMYDRELTAMSLHHKNLITYLETNQIVNDDRISPDVSSRLFCGLGGSHNVTFPHPFSECEQIPDAFLPFVYITMPFSSDGSLQDIAYRRGESGRLFSMGEVLEIAGQILEGVGFLHQNQVIHRDLKPQNILHFSDDNTWKIMDFGLAGATDSAGVARTAYVGGTRGWMAPEQNSGAPIGVNADIFAIGQILYYLLTGKLGFIQGSTPPPAREFNGEVTEHLSGVIAKCMAFDPAHRYQTISEVSEALAPIPIGLSPSNARDFASPDYSDSSQPVQSGLEEQVVRAIRAVRQPSIQPAIDRINSNIVPTVQKGLSRIVGAITLAWGVLTAGITLMLFFSLFSSDGNKVVMFLGVLILSTAAGLHLISGFVILQRGTLKSAALPSGDAASSLRSLEMKSLWLMVLGGFVLGIVGMVVYGAASY